MMAEGGASSSSNSVDEVDDAQDCKLSSYSSNFTSHSTNDSCTVSSSSNIACSSQGGLTGMSHIPCNPFAIKTSIPTRSVADSTENKEARPLVAAPTLKLENYGSSPMSKIILKPSALTVQAEKLKQMNRHDSNSKQEGKENSDESNVVKESKTPESNGKVPKTEIFTPGISTDMTVSSSKSYATESNSTFSLATKKPETSSNGNFVFGQNLHERVLNYESSNEKPPSPEAHNLTFEEAALKKEDLEKMEQQNQAEKLKKSLSESAKEYESKQVKRKFEEVTVITGEEDESNVLQINCKLFAFDKINMNWQERGRGILRLNDREHNGCIQSRVVMRTQGSLRVVLNTKVWAGMTIEHPSQKSVRLTAFDPQGVKVFLVMAQPKDADQLYNALNWRVTTLRSQDEYYLKSNESRSTVEEATSSLSDEPSEKQMRLSSEGSAGGADSSSESAVIVRDASGENSTEGFADSTHVHS